jgi:methanol metabolism-related c-type cytochrome
MMNRISATLALILAATSAVAQMPPGDPAAVETDELGKRYDADGIPTFTIAEDGTVDWHTFSGFRRYSAECHVCHGPDGEGSSYAPALIDSVARMDYYDFNYVVAEGRIHETGGGGQNVMPSFGTNPNVMCYLDDIYIYLRARAQGDLPRGRPGKKDQKNDAYAEAEEACMG